MGQTPAFSGGPDHTNTSARQPVEHLGSDPWVRPRPSSGGTHHAVEPLGSDPWVRPRPSQAGRITPTRRLDSRSNVWVWTHGSDPGLPQAGRIRRSNLWGLTH